MLRDVLHCPSAPYNLISVSRLTDAGYSAIFNGNTVEVRAHNSGTLLAIGDKIAHLYKLRVAPSSSSTPSTFAFPARSWDDWHRSLGHLNMLQSADSKPKTWLRV